MDVMHATVRVRGLRTGAVVVVVFGLLLAATARPETAVPPKADAPSAAPVVLEQFQPPRPKHVNHVSDYYPVDEQRKGEEGWAVLGFMVDPKGKPFEITVLDSTGNKKFEQAAVQALGHSTFEPGTVNGKPTESATEVKMIFGLSGLDSGAGMPFTQNYRELLAAINKNDRPAADAAMGELKITSLYEDAFYGMARYSYARKWGTKSEQLDGLKRALGYEGIARYFSRGDFHGLLATRFSLEVETQRYGEALKTWDTLEKMQFDEKRKALLMHVVESLKVLQTDDRSYAISDVMPNGTWSLELFKRHFRVEVSEGRVSVIKLYCSKRFVSFVFDPNLEYEVKTGFGSCRMEMLGDAETKFTVSQF